jgi:hypothetical protein
MKAVLGAMILLLAVAGTQAGGQKYKMPKPPKPTKAPKHSTSTPSTGDAGSVSNSSGDIYGDVSGISISTGLGMFMPPSAGDGVIISSGGLVINVLGTGMILGGMFPPVPPQP